VICQQLYTIEESRTLVKGFTDRAETTQVSAGILLVSLNKRHDSPTMSVKESVSEAGTLGLKGQYS
jgi:hypothetical protein